MELEGTVNNQTSHIISVPAAHHYFLNKSMYMLHKRIWSQTTPRDYIPHLLIEDESTVNS